MISAATSAALAYGVGIEVAKAAIDIFAANCDRPTLVLYLAKIVEPCCSSFGAEE